MTNPDRHHRAASTVVMVRPDDFAFNCDAAKTNSFASSSDTDGDGNSVLSEQNRIRNAALHEFDSMVAGLRTAAVGVIVLDTPKSAEGTCPDAVFPNNWFSTHQKSCGRTLVIYPMLCENRQREVQIERLLDAAKLCQADGSASEWDIVDLRSTSLEKKSVSPPHVLEGTGALVFCHKNRVAFMGVSPRASPAIAQLLCEKYFDPPYKLVTFDARDEAGAQIYHTNVVLSVCEKLAVVCLDCIAEDVPVGMHSRAEIRRVLEQDLGKTVVSISVDQMKRMAGNCLEIESDSPDIKKRYLAMSTTAYHAFSEAQLEVIRMKGGMEPLHFDIPTIERVGGGSVRCMLAEMF